MQNFKKAIFISLGFSLITSVFAQVSVDPNDKFYAEAQGWELRGLTESKLPLLRPYSLAAIKKILEDVIENGDGYDSELAKSEYERIFSKPYNIYANVGFDAKAVQNMDDDSTESVKNIEAEIGAAGDVFLGEKVALGYKLGIYGETEPYENWAAYAVNKSQDSIFDATTLGSMEAYLNWNVNVQYGNKDIYATAGLSRIGFGPFLKDGLAMNETGYHSANILFSVTREKWSYTSVYESIGATRNYKTNSDWLQNDKFLSFHALRFSPFDFLDVTYYENTVFGGTNIAYLSPAPYMAVQGIGGASDNIQMGLLFEVKPTKGLVWATDFFADDLALDEMVKLNFDSKLRFGLQSGLVFAPENSVVSRMSADYQVIMPYVYSHWDYESSNSGIIEGTTVNRQNYMNAGINIGSALDPNSDKVSFSVKFNPAKRLTLDFNTNFIRHANSAEAFDDDDAAGYVLAKPNQYMTDGSAYMHQLFSDSDSTNGKHVSQAWDCLGFMTSDHKMYVCQAGLSACYDFPKTRGGQFSLKFGYIFEYVKNAGVDTNVYTGIAGDYETNDDGTCTYNGTTYASESEMAKAVATQQKSEWVEQLYDKVNHYFSVGVKYTY